MNGSNTFAINKGKPAYSVPEFDNLSCGTKLKDLELGDGFALENGNAELVAGKINNIKLKYTPEDTTNYEVVDNIEVSVPVDAHTWDEFTEVTAPTCTSNGEKTHKCTVCETQENVKIDALGHTYGQPEYEWSEDGKSCKAIAICTREKCDHEGDYIIEEAGIVTAKITKPSTCTKMGNTTYTAKFSNTMFEEQNKEVVDVPVSESHDWGEWKVTVPATESSEGVETRICKNDSSHTESRKISNPKPSPDDQNKNIDDPDKNTDDINKDTDNSGKDSKNSVTNKISLSGKKVVLSKNSFTYNAKVQKPTVKSIAGNKLKSGTDYTITYSEGNIWSIGSKRRMH